MSDLTPERIRDAAEVLRQLDSGHAVYRTEYSWTPSQLDRKAVILEREQAEAEAKREKRVGELAGELLGIHLDTRASRGWNDFARALIARYPALADPGTCDKGPCCLSNHHEGRCEL